MIYPSSVRCLCANCSRKCSGQYKSELAMSGKLTYLYLTNGAKLTFSCILNQNKTVEIQNEKTPPVFLGREGLLRIS